MMHAYSEYYLQQAQTNLAVMLDTAVCGMGFELDVFYRMFLLSGVADAFGRGTSSYLCGMSGAEMAMEVAERFGKRTRSVRDRVIYERGKEFWTGYVLAYYQWLRAISFYEIEELLPVTEIADMYHPYHEADILRFVEEADRRRREHSGGTRLALRRLQAGISQGQLSLLSGVPVRTIQQYEQRAKEINRAGADTLYALASALFCRMEELMEPG